MKQLFSVDNFKQIYSIQNRKGYFLDRLISQDVYDISLKIIDINNLIKINKRNKNYDNLKKLYDYKEIVLNTKEYYLEKKLQEITDNIRTNNIELIFDNFDLNGKKVYILKDNPEVFFMLKKLQFNLNLAFKVKQSNRYEITTQLKNILNNNFPKYIIRTDIESFYENIPIDRLINKINNNNIISNFSKRLLFNIIREFKNYSNLIKGIPRGIGISAYLSEIYMKDIDNKIKTLPNVIYYSRYVDDIIIVFTSSGQIYNYLSNVKRIVEYEGLSLNLDKTKCFNLLNPSKDSRDKNYIKYNFEFLGYKYFFNNSKKENKLEIGLSSKKKKKYIQKISKTFEEYSIQSRYNEKKARKLLVLRLRYLTENTRLLNAKKHILIGNNFSNSLLTLEKDLKFLDWCLHKYITKLFIYEKLINTNGGHIDITKLQNRLKKFSFVDGFKQKKFCEFNSVNLEKTINLWKNI